MAAPIKNAAKAAAKSADHTLYHIAPQGFWKKFRDVVAVNPDISTGLPIVSLNRNPPPGSRPELYSTPATKASDVALNPYWKRDARRNYPRLSVVTQAQLAQFLLQSPEQQTSIAEPGAEGQTAVAATESKPKELTQALTLLSQEDKLVYAEIANLPTPVSIHKRWVPEQAEDVPHDPHAYWPMQMWK